MPLPGFRLIKADSVTCSEPQVSVTVFNDRVYLVVDQRLSVSDRMLYPVVAFVPVVYNGNSFRVVGYPYPLFFININVIDVIAVHLIVAFVAGDDVRFRDTRVHVDFVYTHTFCRYQQLCLVQRLDSGNVYIAQIRIGVYNPLLPYVVGKDAFFKSTDEKSL